MQETAIGVGYRRDRDLRRDFERRRPLLRERRREAFFALRVRQPFRAARA